MLEGVTEFFESGREGKLPGGQIAKAPKKRPQCKHITQTQRRVSVMTESGPGELAVASRWGVGRSGSTVGGRKRGSRKGSKTRKNPSGRIRSIGESMAVSGWETTEGIIEANDIDPRQKI